jgi:hypothetical protein
MDTATYVWLTTTVRLQRHLATVSIKFHFGKLWIEELSPFGKI